MPGQRQATSIPPWHMWGDTKSTEIRATGGQIVKNEQQITRIQYRRPETFGFLFAVSIPQLIGQNQVGTSLEVAFNLSMGVGRSSVTIPRVAIFNANFDGSPLPSGGLVLWTNSIPNRVGAQGGVPRGYNFTATSWIDTLAFQDLQVSASLALDSAGEATTIKADVSAYFSPRSHVRPEWFEQKFPGNENVGT